MTLSVGAWFGDHVNRCVAISSTHTLCACTVAYKTNKGPFVVFGLTLCNFGVRSEIFPMVLGESGSVVREVRDTMRRLAPSVSDCICIV